MPALSFQKRFVPRVEEGSKTHSIRGYRKYPFKVGDKLALYTGMRTKFCRLLFRTKVTRVEDIRILYVADSSYALIEIDGQSLTFTAMQELAKRDGFTSHADMMTWWLKNNGLPFRGQIIHWAFRPSPEDQHV